MRQAPDTLCNFSINSEILDFTPLHPCAIFQLIMNFWILRFAPECIFSIYIEFLDHFD